MSYLRQILLIPYYVLAVPVYVLHHSLSYLRIYRWALGGHWEHWHLGDPVNGTIWERIPKNKCFRMTGERTSSLFRGNPRCEEHGKAAYPTYTLCKCGRDLTRAPGVAGAYEGDPKTSDTIGYSCPCGRWPRFFWGFGWQYLGDSRDKSATG